MTESTLYKTALTKAMSLCSQREYCKADIVEKLEKWGVSQPDAMKIISVLVNENFLNETRFATAFAKDKFNYNKWGRIKISYHLKYKQISAASIKTALESIDDDLYISTLRSMIDAHKRSVKAKNQYDLKSKLFRFAQSRGFETSLIYDLLSGLD
jgi:regulatory protein